MNVLQQWFSYRNAKRDRPQHERRDSPLGKLLPDRWPHEYTTELLEVINVLGRLVELQPVQAAILDRVCAGPTIDKNDLVGVAGPPEPKFRKGRPAPPEQTSLPNFPNNTYRLVLTKPGRRPKG
jgi:hypothetical protein